jgi:hypothetical protein
MLRLTVAVVVPRARAAPEKLAASATSTKVASSATSIVTLIH